MNGPLLERRLVDLYTAHYESDPALVVLRQRSGARLVHVWATSVGHLASCFRAKSEPSSTDQKSQRDRISEHSGRKLKPNRFAGMLSSTGMSQHLFIVEEQNPGEVFEVWDGVAERTVDVSVDALSTALLERCTKLRIDN